MSSDLDPTIIEGCANLLNEIDKRILVVLRDGRTLIGILRSVDQFANLILHQAVERIHVGSNFGDIPRGVFLVRGDNITIIGEIDKEKEDNSPLHSVSVETILAAQREEQEERKIKDARRIKAFKERGIIIPETGIPHDD
ncbi:U6 snRNA-associated Sm-like protein LSm1 [Folsomia candida]|uniref:U6 snRNA-associated Sm-like protein LSm1 n=1 Tax=Folsomia candida TaxID=158441 RepID=UPI000B90238D|nr:U6 snRNA-associated Sm-like protein LSm1 [Folsomia candida]